MSYSLVGGYGAAAPAPPPGIALVVSADPAASTPAAPASGGYTLAGFGAPAAAAPASPAVAAPAPASTAAGPGPIAAAVYTLPGLSNNAPPASSAAAPPAASAPPAAAAPAAPMSPSAVVSMVMGSLVPPTSSGPVPYPTPAMMLPPSGAPNMSTAPPTVLTAFNRNPQLPYIESDFIYIKSWMLVHKLSPPSWIYSYILWGIIGLWIVASSAFHQSGARSGYAGAIFSKFFLKKQTFRKAGTLKMDKKMGRKHKQPWSLPSYAQMLTLAILVLVAIILSLVGPDYLVPTAKKPLHYYQLRRRGKEHETLIPDGIAPPHYQIQKAWWTFGARTGLISFALFPLIILLGLKYPPFALLAWRFSTEYYFDKLVRLHRWGGRLIYGLTCAHVLGYAIQAAIDVRNPGDHRRTWDFVLLHLPFRYAVAAFTFFTGLMFFSLPYFREKHYEVFYMSHLITIPGTLIFSALHHEPLAWWCWSALILWGLERIARAVRWLRINTVLGKNGVRYRQAKDDTWARMTDSRWGDAGGEKETIFASEKDTDRASFDAHKRSNSDGSFVTMRPGMLPRGSEHFDVTEKPPPGYAHAQLMPGRTIKLRILTRGPFTWAPGQHVIVCLPSICSWQSHPFTVASICDQEHGGDQEIVLFIRAKSGFTKALWDAVAGQVVARGLKDNSDLPKGLKPPRRGGFFRAWVDGPFGSSIRTKWGQHSTAVIFAGGSGVSFAVAMMEYLCMCLAGRDGQSLGGRPGGRGDPRFKIERVRFVWMVREFSHLSWCASTIRRCLDMVPAPYLQVSIFVSSFQGKMMDKDSKDSMAMTMGASMSTDGSGNLLPPMMRHKRPDSMSDDESLSDSGNESSVDLSYMRGHGSMNVTGTESLGHEEHILDLTNFDGDNDARIPGEEQLSYQLRKEGKVRRAQSRRVAAAKRRSVAPRSGMQGVPEEGGPMQVYPATDSEDEMPYTTSPTARMTGTAGGDKRTGYFPEARRAQSGPHLTPTAPLRTGADRPASPAMSDFSPGHARPMSSMDDNSDTMSVRGLRVEIEDKEAEDLAIISEMARPGKPKFEKIVAEEVEISKGSIAVGCCGPVALNAVIRNVVAASINPTRVKNGDMRGSLSLVSEDFEY